MTYRQTNTLRPTEDQFNELMTLQKNTFWEHGAYSWYDPKKIFTDFDDMKERIISWSLEFSYFYQMWWEDDTLLGFRAFMPSEITEDYVGGIIHTASDDGPIPKIIGDDPFWKEKTAKTDIFLGRPDSTGSQQNWMFDKKEITPVWDNKDGESLHEALHLHGCERAYSCVHGRLQKQMLWENRNKLTGFGSAHDIWLQNGYSFNERKQLGFDINTQTSFVYRLIGGHSLGWPSRHALYHIDNVERPDQVPLPYIPSRDEPAKLGLKSAPITPETIGGEVLEYST